ncbi:hypothetical protein CH92_21790 [Stutzerimonas stutzeri]|uniref:Uncharacterized protein n=1 Tax=Stutzerimonas stutzeri TaxID=316 RepID=W8RZK7_STUST|nr:hypothetical protein [Stutzerimonas stutzeri]AHL77566.1 hypothetical protein CH92_21790 [Stutzerimonas stutzeri]MCQ4330470.1 hypothetical protein [Stutzerimonas stutzeri]
MTGRSVEEIDPLEGLIAKLAGDATHAAYQAAVAAGHTLVMAKDGFLVRIDPDGAETPLSVLRAKHKMEIGNVFHVTSPSRR